MVDKADVLALFEDGEEVCRLERQAADGKAQVAVVELFQLCRAQVAGGRIHARRHHYVHLHVISGDAFYEILLRQDAYADKVPVFGRGFAGMEQNDARTQHA